MNLPYGENRRNNRSIKRAERRYYLFAGMTIMEYGQNLIVIIDITSMVG